MGILSSIRNMFKTKYLVETYSRRVDKYYGLCGCSYEHKVVKYDWGDGLDASLERIDSTTRARNLIDSGFKLHGSEFTLK